jgi:DNA-binding Xre family transcriptional regulator
MIKIHLQRLLDRRDMAQRDPSRMTGIRIGTIGMYCNNTIKRMNKEDIAKICYALKCSLCDLMEYKD